MRLSLLPAGFAVLCIPAIASPASAQEAECGILCRINGYISTDHMTATPGEGDAASGGPAKAHHGHAAHKVSLKPPAGSMPAAKRPVVATASQKGAPRKEGAARRPATSAASAGPAIAPAPASNLPKATRTKTATRAVPAPRDSEQPEPAATSPHAAAKPAPPARIAPVAAAAPPRTAKPQTRTASVTIPGSAPAMPAGFQPFAISH